ncbi:type II toxin-antitoxin system RelB/DinJ family antitoxin [Rhizobium sp. C1]|uniref:type II toxin-antitoxin system RelB/DinJ family antitoxin n=1 Tax=Rhizobium sp. C1 TaxID=1349799 RepID=UPI001E52F272|nr:type II toxin-antitoxin system RelB/DinJ family antitoxin [Rhizobium sp. C1]MCD2177387.1 type II toxin-antitoxin system RelB/DinJ family antitoxin [Rhizobium sp. C1]
MTAHTKMIHVRVDDELREEASAVLESFGMSMSDAVRIFLHRVAATQSFPLELKVPNEETKAALEEARAMRQARKARFATPDELFDDLSGK